MKQYLIILLLMTTIQSQEWINVDVSFNLPGDYDMSSGTFTDRNNGWFAEYSNGRIWHTSDGGLTWEIQNDSSKVWMRDILFVDSLHGWATGAYKYTEVGFMLRTVNGGESWEEISTLFVGGIYFFSTTNGFACFDSIYRTVDGGITWQAQTIEPQRLYGIRDIFFIDPKYGWAVGSSGVANDVGAILHTTDGGNTWYPQQPEISEFTQIYFLNRLHGYAFGYNIFFHDGELMETKNGGDDWYYPGLYSPRFNDMVFTTDSAGWLICDYGVIWNTVDCGESWTLVSSGTSVNLNKIVFVEDGSIGYIFGDDATLLKYDNTHNSIDEKISGATSVFQLFQNYPNPFNPTTTIQYEIPQTAHVILTIYNLNGQVVEQLVNRKQEAGEYTVNWSVDDMPSGIYFYRLQIGNQCLAKKMMVMK